MACAGTGDSTACRTSEEGDRKEREAGVTVVGCKYAGANARGPPVIK